MDLRLSGGDGINGQFLARGIRKKLQCARQLQQSLFLTKIERMPDGQREKHQPEIKHQNLLSPRKMTPRGIAIFQQVPEREEIALESQPRVAEFARAVGSIGIPQARILKMNSFNDFPEIWMAELLAQYFLAKCLNVKEKQRGRNSQHYN
ncbi:MAG TPA: hypothetical protein VFL79_03120 [Terriglobia bacterium]|nr:hypothetical protein [Terriglobia bacterium]